MVLKLRLYILDLKLTICQLETELQNEKQKNTELAQEMERVKASSAKQHQISLQTCAEGLVQQGGQITDLTNRVDGQKVQIGHLTAQTKEQGQHLTELDRRMDNYHTQLGMLNKIFFYS